MNPDAARRYPLKQAALDKGDEQSRGRRARLRPGVLLRVRGYRGRERGPAVMGVAVLTRIAGDGGGDEALVPTREYGRRWFRAQAGAVDLIVEEIG